MSTANIGVAASPRRRAATVRSGMISVVLLLSACGGGADASPVGAPAVDATAGQGAQDLREASLRLDFLAGGLHSGLFLALDRGYYEEAGLDIEIGDGRGSAVTVQNVGAGADDFAYASLGATANSVAAGMPVKAVATLSDRNSYGVFFDEDSGIETLEDLYGKQVLVVSGTPDVYLMEAVFEANGLDISQVDLQAVEAASKVTLYTQGQGDAVVTVIPFGDPLIQPHRPSETMAWADFGLVLVDYGLVVNTEMLESEPHLVEGFVNASLRGYRDAIEDPEAAVDAVMKHRPDADREAVEGQWSAFQEHLADPVGCASEDEWSDSLELLAQYGGLEGDISDVEEYFTPQFVSDCEW